MPNPAPTPTPVPPVPAVPTPPALSGPYGPLTNQTDSSLAIHWRNALGWVVNKVTAVLGHTETVSVYAQAADAAEATIRANAIALEGHLRSEADAAETAARIAAVSNEASLRTAGDTYVDNRLTGAWADLIQVDNTLDARITSEKNALVTSINTKANNNSPALTGTPTAPTPVGGDRTTKLATTAYVMRSEDYVVGLVNDTQSQVSGKASTSALNTEITNRVNGDNYVDNRLTGAWAEITGRLDAIETRLNQGGL